MGMKAPSTGFKTTVSGDRIQWSDIKDRIDLGVVATALLGPSPGRRGGKGRLWWNCPFHDDKNPSLHVDADKQTWKCYGCSEHGDSASLVMKYQRITFPEAIRWLADRSNVIVESSSGQVKNQLPPRGRQVSDLGRSPRSASRTEQPSGLPLADALGLVEDAEKRLGAPEGADALAYLNSRGLTEATIKAARLGWTPGVMVPKRDRPGCWHASGVTVPWFDGDRLALVKIRQPEGSKPKYGEAFRDRPTMFPAPSVVRPGKPLIVTEGEFDCLLMAQELADLDASVVTLGSASARLDPAVLDVVLAAPTWYLALDADPAGDKSAESWPARARRIRPPAPHKDWGEFHRAGFNNIRYVWGAILKRPPTPWPILEAQRWGNFDPSAS